MRRWGVPRSKGLLRRHVAGSSAGHGPFAPACGGEFRGAWAFCAGMWRGVPWGTGLLRRQAEGAFRGTWAFCASMRRGEEVPRGTGLLRRHAAESSSGHGFFAHAAAGEFLGARAFCAGMRRGGGVPRRASDLVRAAARPGAGPFRQNGKSTENREKLRIGPKQRIDGI